MTFSRFRIGFELVEICSLDHTMHRFVRCQILLSAEIMTDRL